MNKSIELLTSFGMSSCQIDPDGLMLALTHKQVLNEKGNKENFIKLEYYEEFGRKIYDILLKNFIHDNFSKEKSAITKVNSASKYIFINELLSKYNIKEYMIYKENTLNSKVESQLVFQMIGFLYTESSYKHLEKIFDSVFKVSKLVLIDDYLGLINSYAKNQHVEISELEVSGDEHTKKYKYELKLNNKSVIAEAKTKRGAKEKCSKKYCDKFLTEDDILIFSGIKTEKKLSNKKKYFIDKKTNESLYKISNKLGISRDNLLSSFTHISATNEYDLVDSSAVKAIGASLEQLYLLEKFYKNNKNKSFVEVHRMVTFMHCNEDVHNFFLKQYNLSSLLIAANGVYKNKESLKTAYKDAFNAIIYFVFHKNKDIKSIEIFDNLYNMTLDTIDENYIDSTSVLHEVMDKLKLSIYYEFTQDEHALIWKTNILIPELSMSNKASARSKTEAKFIASKNIMKWYYEEFEQFLSGNKNKKLDFIGIENILIFLIDNRPLEFKKVVFENNYFGLIDAREGNIFLFIKIFSTIIKNAIQLFKSSNVDKIIIYLITLAEFPLAFLNGTNYLLEAAILNIYHFQQEQSKQKINNEEYSLLRSEKQLSKLNSELLLKKITANGILIKDVNDPDLRLQLAAIKNNPDAIHYLISPAKEVFEYLMETDVNKSTELLIINKAKDDINYLIDWTSKKYEEYINKNKENRLFSIVSHNVTFDIHIRALFKIASINNFYIATGFVYSSGLELLESEIKHLLEKNGELKIIAGNLQNYNQGKTMKNMDSKTASYLNKIINNGALIKTYDKSFYHGKIYILESDFLDIVIVGSTNLSKNAFHRNIELDNIFFLRKDKENEYLTWFTNFWQDATPIEALDVSRFSTGFNFDINNESESTLKKITEENVQERINTIPDKLLKKRLLLWLEYHPINIYDDINVANQKYIAIEYSENKMIVLESFIHGNSYFVFYNIGIEDLLDNIKNMTKKEIFIFSSMEKRGYHIRESLKLELNIKSYFIY